MQLIYFKLRLLANKEVFRKTSFFIHGLISSHLISSKQESKHFLSIRPLSVQAYKRGVDVYLGFNLIAPSTLQVQFLPRSSDVDLENMAIDFADADRVEWNNFSEDCDHQFIFVRDLRKGGKIDTWKSC
jgi:hypothetical protein